MEEVRSGGSGLGPGDLGRALSGGGCSTEGVIGKVENGPSWTMRLPGGLPRILLLVELLLGHADETAGPCLRRCRALRGVLADWNSSRVASAATLLVTADEGCGVGGIP